MRFEVAYSLQQLGDPLPPFYRQEALSKLDRTQLAEARSALRELGTTDATQKLKELLRLI